VQSPRGSFLLAAMLFVWLGISCGREFLLNREETPAFYVENRRGIVLLLGRGFPLPGVHQFSDGITPEGVIKMTGLRVSDELSRNLGLARSLNDGNAMDVVVVDGEVVEFKKFWMPASQRMALGVPLHPDRMTTEDWEELPGIGSKLAKAIEMERQQNGDFGSIAGLQRVKGIGLKRLAAWEKYFHSCSQDF